MHWKEVFIGHFLECLNSSKITRSCHEHFLTSTQQIVLTCLTALRMSGVQARNFSTFEHEVRALLSGGSSLQATRASFGHRDGRGGFEGGLVEFDDVGG